MSELLVLEFSAPNVVELYRTVSRLLDVDPSTGAGDWPEPLETHVAGVAGDDLIVVEVWESKEIQAKFMQDRLGPALQQANAPAPSRVEWFSLAGQMRA